MKLITVYIPNILEKQKERLDMGHLCPYGGDFSILHDIC